jgi:hypothetical protein
MFNLGYFMKTLFNLSLFIFGILLISCKDEPASPADNPKVGFDIQLDSNLYYTEEIFPENYLGIYDQWNLDGYSGGFAGNSYNADYRKLVFERYGIFKFFVNDSLYSYGKIEIQPDEYSSLLVYFNVDSVIFGRSSTGFRKYVTLSGNSLGLRDPWPDGYNSTYTRCGVYADMNYYQKSPIIENGSITKIKIPGVYIIRSVYFIDSSKGYLVCGGSTVLNTVDAGESWEADTIGTGMNLNGICFINSQTGFIVGCKAKTEYSKSLGSILFRTIDAGNSWEQLAIPEKGELLSIIFLDDETGFAYGRNLVLKTSDGGANWREVTIGNSSSIYKMSFINQTIGFASLYGPGLLKSSDGGESWTNRNSGTFSDIQFVNENTGYLLSYSGFCKTTDGGLSTTLLPFSPEHIEAFYFENEDEGVVLGYRKYSSGDCHVWGSFMHLTTNGGLCWQGDNRILPSGNLNLMTNRLCSPVKGTYYGIENFLAREIVRIDIK